MAKLLDLFKKRKKSGWGNYPKSVKEVLSDKVEYPEDIHMAVRKFQDMRPWNGRKKEIQEKFRSFCFDLALACEIEQPQLIFVRAFDYGSCYFPLGNLIVLEEEFDGKYSVITFLHEFGHALGKTERETCKWSINLFRIHFPQSYAKLVPMGHMLFKKTSPNLKSA